MWTWLKRIVATLGALGALWGLARALGDRREAGERAAEKVLQRRSARNAAEADEREEERKQALADGHAAAERMRRELEDAGEREPDLGRIAKAYNGRRGDDY